MKQKTGSSEPAFCTNRGQWLFRFVKSVGGHLAIDHYFIQLQGGIFLAVETECRHGRNLNIVLQGALNIHLGNIALAEGRFAPV